MPLCVHVNLEKPIIGLNYDFKEDGQNLDPLQQWSRVFDLLAVYRPGYNAKQLRLTLSGCP